MPSVAELIKRQTSQQRQKPIVRMTEPTPVQPKLPSRMDAMYNFLDDRNYSDTPTEYPTSFNKSYIYETLQKENPDDYIQAVPNSKQTQLHNADQSKVELDLSGLAAYSLLRKTGVK